MIRRLIVLVLILLLSGCASWRSDFSCHDDALFPQPERLRPNVEFWQRVYAEWSEQQVAIHDNRYLGIVYEVIDLSPELVRDHIARRQALAEHRQRWQTQLRRLEEQVADGATLSTADRRLLDKIRAQDQQALQGAAGRVRAQRGLRERFRRGLEISGRYDSAFREIFRSYGLPEDLAYLPHVESSFQYHARSSVGATGMWQFMRPTARQYMTVSLLIDERLDPLIAADAAARYLRDAYRVLGYWPLALTAYNHGTSGMQRARAQFGNAMDRIVFEYQGPRFGFASRNFYAEFLAARQVACTARRYFPEGWTLEQPQLSHSVQLSNPLTIDALAQRYAVSRQELIALNPSWLAPLREGRQAVPAGTLVRLPGAKPTSTHATTD